MIRSAPDCALPRRRALVRGEPGLGDVGLAALVALLAGLFAAPLAAATPAADAPGIVETFLRAGLMAKVVLATLAVFSLVSWAIIFSKALHLRRVDEHTVKFLEHFHRSKRFSEVSAMANRLHSSPMVGIFQTGYAEIDAQMKAGEDTEAGARYRLRSLTALERSLQRAIHLEVASLGRWTPFLATTAAAAPFIGLFGTVWGIMVAFQDIGLTGSTSLTVVAPGIAEALINTAAGLAAAIPALVAYNYFAARLRRLRLRMDDFALELLNLAERNFT
ncbi:MAG TPA: MotA/TolQ/ExbB proton channel family protein [Thermoanaerobaculia bacterium]|nr:MotA/TolQ/ExbB proton channel family protein [Thermoanaerobaculia bacterium]